MNDEINPGNHEAKDLKLSDTHKQDHKKKNRYLDFIADLIGAIIGYLAFYLLFRKKISSNENKLQQNISIDTNRDV